MKKLYTLMIFFAAALSLHAELLSLQTCIDKAVSNHPDVKAFLYRVQEQERGVEIRRGARRPQISAFAQYDPQRTYALPVNGQFHTVDDDALTAGITLKQKLYDFSKTSADIEAAKIGREIASLSYEEAAALMRYKVRSAYTLLLVQKRALEVRRKDLEAKRALYEQARALVEQGLKTKADESRFFASLKGAEDALASAKAAYKKARISLERYIAEPIGPSAHFEEALLTRSDPIPVPDEERMLGRNLKLKISENERRANHQRYVAAKADRFGSLDLLAEAVHNETLSTYNTTQIGVRYALPLYNGGRIKAQAQQAKISEMKAVEQSASERLALLEEYRSLRADLEEIDHRIEAQKAQEEAARQTSELIRARYAEGLATYMEVLDAEAVRLDANLKLLEAYLVRKTRLYRLEYLNGQ